MTTRRDFAMGSISGFVLYALLGEVRAATAGRPRDAHVEAWIARQDELARTLAEGELDPGAWQDGVEALAREIDLGELAAFVARAEQHDAGRGMPTDPQKRIIVFRDAAGERRNRHYGAALFTFSRDNVITPHGHRHMVSAHLVLEGKLRVRNFDRVGDEDGAMVLRASADRIIGTGDISTMSSARDNVHWFVPAGERAVTFDVIVSDLDPGMPSYRVEAVDPVRGKRREDGTILAPIITFAESSRLFTREV